jgi:hypothetical protein
MAKKKKGGKKKKGKGSGNAKQIWSQFFFIKKILNNIFLCVNHA